MLSSLFVWVHQRHYYYVIQRLFVFSDIRSKGKVLHPTLACVIFVLENQTKFVAVNVMSTHGKITLGFNPSEKCFAQSGFATRGLPDER
jgi:hypothetical protein